VAGIIGLASVIGPTVAGIEALRDVPALEQSAVDAGKTAEHLEDTYRETAANPDTAHISYDQATQKLQVTLRKDPKLTLEPIQETFSRFDDTKDDAARLKWLALGGAVGVLAAAAVGRTDRSLRRGGNTREGIVDVARDKRWLFASLLLSTAPATGLFLYGGHLQHDAAKLSRLDLDKVTQVSDDMQRDLRDLDITVTQPDDKHTQVSLKLDVDALHRLNSHAESLGPLMPGITEEDIALDGFTLSVATLALAGLAGTGIGTVSSIGHPARGRGRGGYRSLMQRGFQDLHNQGRDSEIPLVASKY
jgi:hypothetical protein